MSSYIEAIENITPEIYENLKRLPSSWASGAMGAN